MRATKLFLVVLTVIAFASLPAFANSCLTFGGFTCSKSTPDVARFSGTVSAGQSGGILLGGNSFTVSLQGNHAFAGDDLILLAAAPNGLTGTVNGIGFTSLSSFPEQGAVGSIGAIWAGLNISAGNVQYGYANLGPIGSLPFSVNASGVGNDTIFYAVFVNSQGKIVYITPNSEVGVLNVPGTVTPEPASLTFLGTGLAAIAGLVRRKAIKK